MLVTAGRCLGFTGVRGLRCIGKGVFFCMCVWPHGVQYHLPPSDDRDIYLFFLMEVLLCSSEQVGSVQCRDIDLL
jgi:hypothetical protein